MKKLYQPEWYHDDGTNIEYGGVPDGLYSWQVFSTKEAAEAWLIDNDYDVNDFVISEYTEEDIEDYTIID